MTAKDPDGTVSSWEHSEGSKDNEDFKREQFRKEHSMNENLLRRCIANVSLELAPTTVPQTTHGKPQTTTTFPLFNADFSSIPPPLTSQLPLTQTDAAYLIYHDDPLHDTSSKLTKGTCHKEFYSVPLSTTV
ncbi:unnamed protein product [Toxocara canis]|uniref:SKICH domain-containing protein n=1 Tax=Toxocara canis TaxID=6265 RepID=A0A183VCG6_TOXCA|nr:unnamed protein product [Toxocara canis]